MNQTTAEYNKKSWWSKNFGSATDEYSAQINMYTESNRGNLQKVEIIDAEIAKRKAVQKTE